MAHKRSPSLQGEKSETKITVRPWSLGTDKFNHLRSGRSLSLPSIPVISSSPSRSAPSDDSDVDSYRSHVPENYLEYREKFLTLRMTSSTLLPCQQWAFGNTTASPSRQPDFEVFSYVAALQSLLRKNAGLVFIRQKDKIIPLLPDFLVFSSIQGAKSSSCNMGEYRWCRNAYFSVLALSAVDSFVRVLAITDTRAYSIATISDFHISAEDLKTLFLTGQVRQSVSYEEPAINWQERQLTLFTLADILTFDLSNLNAEEKS